jgi:hypothetical protein
LYFLKGVMIGQKVWPSTSSSSSTIENGILMPSLMKNLFPMHMCRILVMIDKGCCLWLITLFNWCRSLIQQTLPSFLGMMKEGHAHSLSCQGIRTPSQTRWSNSHLNVDRWIRGTW